MGFCLYIHDVWLLLCTCSIGTTVLQAVRQMVSVSTEVVYSRRARMSLIKDKGFKYAIVVVGEPPYAESYGDNTNLTIPLQGTHTITNTCRYVKCVVVIMSGRPLLIEPHLHIMDALVAAWLPGTEAGLGIADVLFGSYDFTGKLSRTWFRNINQLPMNIGDKHYDPLFSFGFGLTMGLQNNRYFNLFLFAFYIHELSRPSSIVWLMNYFLWSRGMIPQDNEVNLTFPACYGKLPGIDGALPLVSVIFISIAVNGCAKRHHWNN